jgi:hypothetical protein
MRLPMNVSSTRKPFAALWIAACLAMAFADAHAGPWALAPGEYYSEFRGISASTGSLFDYDGNLVPLPDDGRIQDRTLMASNELGWKNGWNVLFSIPLKSLTQRSAAQPTGRTETGLSDASFALRWTPYRGGGAVAVTAGWRGPLGYNRALSPRLGDGLQETAAALEVGVPLGSYGFLQGLQGVRYRFLKSPGSKEAGELRHEQLQATFGGDLGVWLGRSILLAAHYQGIVSIGDRDFVEDSYDLNEVGPLLLVRVDDRLDVFAGSTHPVQARNTVGPDRYYVGVAFKQTTLGRQQGYLGGKGAR